MAGRCRRLFRLRRRVPHGLPFSCHAAAVHVRPYGGPFSDYRHSRTNAADSRPCQWALFLRNHDELTLEMVTDEDRDYMYNVYATDPRARINLGIRRRLAPLLGNNRRKMELLNSLLFSLPGTPVIYYGDEIGMGDNIYLGDRNGVRTPMQWSADRNAGFSRANPQRLYLPVIIDPEHHYETVNVEAQQQNPSSLLWWMKRLVLLRKNYQSFGRGTIEFLYPENHKVLVFIRRFRRRDYFGGGQSFPLRQYVELDLAAYKGMVPVELFGHTRFPAIGELPYFLTLGPHSFYWFKLEQARISEARAPRKDSSLHAWRSPAPGKIFSMAGPAPHWSEFSPPICSPAAGSAARRNPFAR